MLIFKLKNVDKVLAMMAGYEDRVKRALEVGTIKATMKTVRLTKLNLSDVVLKVKTGRLRRSINERIVGQGTGAVHGVVGTNVKYGRVHEYGGPVTIKQHQRMMTKAWGKPVKSPRRITVNEHVVNYPKRSFLRDALYAMQESGELKKTYQQALEKEFKKT